MKRPEVLYGALPMADHGCCLELHPLQVMDRNQVRDRALPLVDHGCYVELHPFQAKDRNQVRDGALPQWLQGTTRKLDMLLYESGFMMGTDSRGICKTVCQL